MNSQQRDARKNEQILMDLLKEEANKHCADCGQKGARWASWNLGVFLCIRCGGIHRKLGTHISKVKSVNLDKWTDEQIESIMEKGNAKMNELYNPNPDRFPFPAYSGDQEQYIRDKYERRLFMNGGGSRSAYDSVNSTSSNFHPKSSTSPTFQSASTSRRQSSFSKSNNIATSPTDTTNPRYPLQLKALKDMGFTDEAANIIAINSTAGNLPQAIDLLLSKRSSNLSLSSSPTPATKPSDDLADIFGVVSPPPPPTTTATPPPANTITSPVSKSQPVLSILDLDPQETALMTEESKKGEESEEVEFNDFEFAPNPPSTRRPSLPSATPPTSNHATTTLPQYDQPPHYVTRTSSVAPIVSNPWTTLNEEDNENEDDMNSESRQGSNGNVFDEIDPFRGFVAHK